MLLLLLSHFSHCLTLCDSINGSPTGSSVRGILQARTLEWVAISFSRASSRPLGPTYIFCICKWILYPQATWEALIRL